MGYVRIESAIGVAERFEAPFHVDSNFIFHRQFDRLFNIVQRFIISVSEQKRIVTAAYVRSNSPAIFPAGCVLKQQNAAKINRNNVDRELKLDNNGWSRGGYREKHWFARKYSSKNVGWV